MENLFCLSWCLIMYSTSLGGLSGLGAFYEKGQPGGATPLPHAGGQEQRLGGPTPVQGVVAARAQEGLEELLHVQGHEGW